MWHFACQRPQLFFILFFFFSQVKSSQVNFYLHSPISQIRVCLRGLYNLYGVCDTFCNAQPSEERGKSFLNRGENGRNHSGGIPLPRADMQEQEIKKKTTPPEITILFSRFLTHFHSHPISDTNPTSSEESPFLKEKILE